MRQTTTSALAAMHPIGYIILAVLMTLVIILLPPLQTLMLFGLAVIAGLSLLTPAAMFVVFLIFAPLNVLLETEAPGIVPADIGQIMLIVFMGTYALHMIIMRRNPTENLSTTLWGPLGAFVAIWGLTVVGAWSVNAWLREWLKWVQVLILLAVTRQICTRVHWRWIVFALVTAALANAFVGIYQFFGGSGALHLLVNGRFFRAFGTFGQPNPFGGFMGLILPLAFVSALGALWRIWGRLRKQQSITSAHWLVLLYFTAAALALTLALLMSWSRGAWLGFIAALGIMTISLPRKLWQSIALLIGGLVFATTLVGFGLLPDAIASRLSSIRADFVGTIDVRGVDITTANYAVVERLAHWQAAIRMAEANVWLGVGAGNYTTAYPSYQILNWDEPLGHAHNYYLNVLAEGGIISLVMYVTMWVSVLIISWQTRRHPDWEARLLAIGLLGSWVYLSVHSMTDKLYVNNLFLFLGVMFGLLAFLNHQVATTSSLE